MTASDAIVAKASATLKAFEAAHGLLKPPVPIEVLAGWLGFQIIPLFLVPGHFSAIVSEKEKLIGINAHHGRRRQRFSIGHEIGHIILRHPPESHCSQSEVLRHNREADVCASELLMPGCLVHAMLGRVENRIVLAGIFDVSVQAMELRIAALKASAPVQTRP